MRATHFALTKKIIPHINFTNLRFFIYFIKMYTSKHSFKGVNMQVGNGINNRNFQPTDERSRYEQHNKSNDATFWITHLSKRSMITGALSIVFTKTSLATGLIYGGISSFCNLGFRQDYKKIDEKASTQVKAINYLFAHTFPLVVCFGIIVSSNRILKMPSPVSEPFVAIYPPVNLNQLIPKRKKMNNIDMADCREYARGDIFEARIDYDVREYRKVLDDKINSLCLEMGYIRRNDKPKYQKLRSELIKNIYEISTDEQVRDKLFAYANRVINIGENYFILRRDD